MQPQPCQNPLSSARHSKAQGRDAHMLVHGGICSGAGPLGQLPPAVVSSSFNSLLWDSAGEELTKAVLGALNSSMSYTQREAHDVFSSLSRLAESRAGPS